MSSVDNRIVNMEFNNKGFESGVSTTLNSLKKLNESLKMKDATSGINDVDKSVKNLAHVGMGSLIDSADSVTSKYAMLASFLDGVFENLGGRAVDIGMKIGKALTIDPIKTGFDEYETKMGAIQTILTNTAHAGTTMDDVTAALNNLNKYADQTIYNFAEMTKNIGTFTAAGIDLDTSTAAIKGIANLAAASGSNAQQASTAMYQLSQALAAGKVSLADWNSVVNAGMGGKLFQDALVRTSEVLGTNAEGMIKKYGSFRESLTKGEWLTSEVLTETLKQLSGAYTEADLIAQGFSKSQAQEIVKLAKNATAAATEVKTVTQLIDTMKESVQSGWATSWEWIIGDKDQATKTLTSISDAFNGVMGPIADARNAMLEFWNKNDGRDAVIRGLTTVFQSLGKVMGAIGKAWKEVFPPMTGEKLVELSKGFENFTKKLKVSDETINKIKTTFKGIFSVFDLVKDAIVNLVSAFVPCTDIFSGLGGIILNVTSTIGSFFTKLNDGAKSTKIFERIGSSIKKALTSIGDMFNGVKKSTTGLFKELGDLNFKPVLDGITKFGEGLGGGVFKVLEGVGKMVGTINFNTLLGAFTALASKNILGNIKTIFKDLASSMKDLKSFSSGVKSVLDSVRSALEAYQSNLQAGTLLKIASAIGILAVSLGILAGIDAPAMETALTGITVLFIELIAGMGMLIKLLNGTNVKGFFSVGTAMITMAAAISVLASAVKKLSELSWEEIAKGLAGVAGSMVVLVGGVKLLDGPAKGLQKTATGMVLLAAALQVMAGAVKKFGELDTTVLLKGLGGVAVALLELSVFMNLTNLGSMGTKVGAGILALATSMVVLQNAVAKFGDMDLTAMIQGLAGVAVVLAEVAAFSHLAGNGVNFTVISAGMVIFAGAMLVLSSAVKSFGNIQWDEMARGLTAMAAGLTVVGVAVKLISGLSLAATGAGLVVMSAGLLTMSAAIKSLAELSWDEMARGLTALAGGLTVLGVAMYAMSGCLAGAAAMVVMAGALAIFTPQLMALSKLSWSALAVGLAALAGSLTVIGVAGALITPAIPGLLGLAAAITLLGVGAAAAGAGVALFATGLATLAGVGVAGVAAFTYALKEMIKLIPELGTKMGEGFVGMVTAIGNGIPQILDAFGKMFVGILESFTTYIPKIGEVFVQLLLSLCDVLSRTGPQLITTFVNLIIKLIESIAANAGKFVEAAVTLVINFINGLASTMGQLIQAGIDLIIALMDGITQGIQNNYERFGTSLGNMLKAVIVGLPAMLLAACKALGGDLLTGIVNGVKTKGPELLNSITTIVKNVLTFIKNKVSEFLTAGGQWISNLASGIKSKVSTVTSNISNMCTTAITNVKNKVSQFLSAGGQWISNLANGIKSKVSTVTSNITNMCNTVVNNIKSKASQFLSNGSQWISNLASGIRSKVSSVTSNITSMCTTAINSVKGKVGQFLSAGGQWISNVATGIRNKVSSVTSAVSSMATSALNHVKNKASQFTSAASKWISNMVSGIKSKVSSVTSAVSSCATSAVNAAKSKASAMVSAGAQLISGFINGIKSKAASIASAAKSVVQNAITAAKNALKIKSPSRVFMEIGRYTALGMAVGLDNTSDKVVASSEALANAAIDNVSRTVGAISKTISGDMDYIPVIKPVMDLSNVENGSRTIGELLSDKHSIDLSADATGVITKSIGPIQNGNNNDDVVAALKDLQDAVNHSQPGNTYQINGITYDDGSNVRDAVQSLVKAATIERRI